VYDIYDFFEVNLSSIMKQFYHFSIKPVTPLLIRHNNSYARVRLIIKVMRNKQCALSLQNLQGQLTVQEENDCGNKAYYELTAKTDIEFTD